MSFNVTGVKDGRKHREFCRLASDARKLSELWQAGGTANVRVVTSEGATISIETLRALERYEAPTARDRTRAA